jgi:hypothetical protein
MREKPLNYVSNLMGEPHFDYRGYKTLGLVGHFFKLNYSNMEQVLFKDIDDRINGYHQDKDDPHKIILE